MGARLAKHKNENPTHGSQWMVQVLSTDTSLIEIESYPRQWVDGSSPHYS